MIVATSTLELGIDVGDLDRVIQIDSPPTVAGFLQRIGRTGRRPGSSRNALFLTTSPDALLTAAGLLRLWASGYVEPAQPPAMPAHLLAQQVLALTLQEADNGLARTRWTEWLGSPPVFPPDAMSYADTLVEHLLGTGWLHEDEGLLSPGPRAERKLGRRNFLELTSVFVADPLVSIRQGKNEIGSVPDIAMTAAFANRNGPPMILLAGRAWRIRDVDWRRRVAHVEPGDEHAKIRFSGSVGALSFELCQSIAAVLAGGSLEPVTLTQRAMDALEEQQSTLRNVQPGRTALVDGPSGRRWYTFAGLRANLELAARISSARANVTQRENLYIAVDEQTDADGLREALDAPTDDSQLIDLISDVSGSLKLEEALPEALVTDETIRRFTDSSAVSLVLRAPIDRVR